MPSTRYGASLPSTISSRPTGEAKSCSMEPRSHSPATVRAVRSTALIARMYAARPGTMKSAERPAGL